MSQTQTPHENTQNAKKKGKTFTKVFSTRKQKINNDAKYSFLFSLKVWNNFEKN